MKVVWSMALGAAVLGIGLGVATVALFTSREARVPERDPALTPEQVFSLASRSVAMIYAADSSRKIVGRGSGVFVGRGLLATNCHVIARGAVIRVGHGGQHWNGRLAAYDVETDMCVIAVLGLDAAPVSAGSANALRVGQRVYAIGTPEGFELTFSEGVISGLREANGRRYIQTTAPISEGSSGGGLFDSRGRLIGITSFVFSSGQNLNFAAPAEWALDLSKKAVQTGTDEAARPVELPPGYAKQWRHPVLK